MKLRTGGFSSKLWQSRLKECSLKQKAAAVVCPEFGGLLLTAVVRLLFFHSPRACAHVARSMDISAQYRALANGAAENLKPIPVVSSMLQEKHSIFGGADRLRACIEDVVILIAKCLIICQFLCGRSYW